MNLEGFVKDGIFKVKCNNPYVNYVVVKTYGNIQMKRAIGSLEDAHDQVSEWDSEYGYLVEKAKKVDARKARKATAYLYRVVDANGNVINEGSANDIANEYGVAPKTVRNVACSNNGRHLKVKREDGNNSYFSLERIMA